MADTKKVKEAKEVKVTAIKMAALSKIGSFPETFEGLKISVEAESDDINKTGRWNPKKEKKPHPTALFTVTGPGASVFTKSLVKYGLAVTL